MTDIEAIKHMYDKGAEYEERRLFRSPIHRAEFVLSTDVLKNHITQGSKVIDIGSGPGIYSEFLLKELNCHVSLVDLSEKSLALFQNRITSELKARVDLVKVGSATELDWLSDETFDYVLLFGPLYHLISETERNNVLTSAYRILKPNGLVFCAFISPHRRYTEILQTGPTMIMDEKYLRTLEEGITIHEFEGIAAEQYRCWPHEATQLLNANGFDILHKRSLEGIFSYLPSEQWKHLEEENVFEQFINTLRKTCEIPELLGSTLHYLIVSQKPLLSQHGWP